MSVFSDDIVPQPTLAKHKPSKQPPLWLALLHRIAHRNGLTCVQLLKTPTLLQLARDVYAREAQSGAQGGP